MWLIQGKTKVNLAHVNAIVESAAGGEPRLSFYLNDTYTTIDPNKPVQIVSDEVMLQMLRAELTGVTPSQTR